MSATAHVSGLAKMDELDLEEADAWHLTEKGTTNIYDHLWSFRKSIGMW